MAVNKPSYQLKLDLDLPDAIVADAGALALSTEDIRLRSEAARQKLEGGELWPVGENGEKNIPAWYEEYIKLLIGKWPWRVAVYMAWLAQPKPRWPETQMELAKMLGLSSDRQFSVWRAKNPAIDAMVQDVRFGMIFERLGDVINAGLDVASIPDYKSKGDRELIYKLAGVLNDKIETNILNAVGVVDLSQLSFEDKLRMAGLDNPDEMAEFKKELAAGRPSFDDGEEVIDGDCITGSGDAS